MEPPYIGIGAVKFLSTPSVRRATRAAPARVAAMHISIHALREEGDYSQSAYLPHGEISIHALREEGDQSCQK